MAEELLKNFKSGFYLGTKVVDDISFVPKILLICDHMWFGENCHLKSGKS